MMLPWVMLVGTALIAAIAPVVRAVHIDPMEMLRAD
jgi:ABC-type lipoprotein release transport system permease subunit